MLDVVWDMESHDPDDFITLLLLLGHPAVRLKAVTVTPGSTHQIGLVREALSWFGATIPVGAHNLDHPSECVSSWHRRAYGAIAPSRDAEHGPTLLHRVCDANTTLITGGPLKNLGGALKIPGFTLGRLVAQGGFAGDGVVPPEKQLAKFRGRTTCPTFNLNGDPKSALAALASDAIGERRFVSKNVCHGVVYNYAWHERLTQIKDRSRSLERIWHGMDVYLYRRFGSEAGRLVNEAIPFEEVLLVGADGARIGPTPLREAIEAARALKLDLVMVSPEGRHDARPVCAIRSARSVEAPGDDDGKKFHDPLAACCAIDPSIATWAEVNLYRERGEWGARLAPNTRTWIITDYDPARFFDVLTAARSGLPSDQT